MVLDVILLNGKPQYMKIYSTFGLSRPLKDQQWRKVAKKRMFFHVHEPASSNLTRNHLVRSR